VVVKVVSEVVDPNHKRVDVQGNGAHHEARAAPLGARNQFTGRLMKREQYDGRTRPHRFALDARVRVEPLQVR